MAVEMVRWCDLHYPEQRHEGHDIVFGIEGQWYEAQIAEDCETELWEMPFALVLQFFQQKGVVAKEAPKPKRQIASKTYLRQFGDHVDRGPLPCLWCDNISDTPGALKGHLFRSHGFKKPDDGWGNRCPECDSDYERLSSHSTQAHGVHVAQLFDKLKGRPVVEARRGIKA